MGYQTRQEYTNIIARQYKLNGQIHKSPDMLKKHYNNCRYCNFCTTQSILPIDSSE